MEPYTREERDRIIREHPNAAPGEIESDLDEYELLVSRIFRSDPDRPGFAAEFQSDRDSVRLDELQKKLFG